VCLHPNGHPGAEGRATVRPAFAGDTGTLGRDFLLGHISKVAYHLPADRRVGVQQLVDYVTGSDAVIDVHICVKAQMVPRPVSASPFRKRNIISSVAAAGNP
jgi:hypothetical protein